jgi:hypothetical protein
MRAVVMLSGGPAGFAERFEAGLLHLDLEGPVPPGTRVDGTVAGRLAIRGKVVQARRSAAPGVFRVVLKLMDLSRDDRGWLERELLNRP